MEQFVIEQFVTEQFVLEQYVSYKEGMACLTK